MKNLSLYKELVKSSNTYPSIKDAISDTESPNKDKILRYLRNGKVIAAAAGVARDIFTGERIDGEFLLFSDDKYEWSTEIVHYYDKYNLALPQDFIDNVMSKF